MSDVPSAIAYAARVDAYHSQAARTSSPTTDRWASRAANFRLDPRRTLEANTAAVAALVEPDDVVVDVGGGAGRIGLPLALRSREVLNIEPSAGMREQFDASARDAGITNVRCIPGAWPDTAAGIAADVVIVANVTYFVRDIVPFVEALKHVARKRVIIAVWSSPPPNHTAALFELLHGEPQVHVPTHRELLAVIWDLGILPDVRVLPDTFRGARERPPTRAEAIRYAVERGSAEQIPRAAEIVEAHFDQLFTASPGGFLPAWVPPAREILIII